MREIHYKKGNIFESDAQILVNPVNCRGVMGKGLAAEFKQHFPRMFQVYQRECKDGRLRVGRPTLYRDSTPMVLNFPTKDHWKHPSTLEIIETGLQYLISNYQKTEMSSIAFPKLGTGEGGLPWTEVGPLMVRYLSQMDIPVTIYLDGPEDIHYQMAEAFTSLQIGASCKKYDPNFTTLEGLDSQICLVKDNRHMPTKYFYICRDRMVEAVLNEEWGKILYEAIKEQYP